LPITVTQDQDPKKPGTTKPEDIEATPEEDAPTGRKERVIHTRVPAVLERELKRMASSLRVPVSNVVRVILEDAVEAVDRVGRKAEGEMRGIAARLAHNRDRLRGMALRADRDDEVRGGEGGGDEGRGEPGRGTSQPRSGDRTVAKPRRAAREPQGGEVLEGVIGFQPLVLAKRAKCALCGRPLGAGDEAFFGVRSDGGPRVLIGRECLPATGQRNEDMEDDS
jgi:hypothetical protein